MEYDEIVVGAGSAGSVMAARLSEDSGRQVLLIEAGADYPDAATVPADLLAGHAAVVQGHNWDIKAYVREAGLLNTLRGAGVAFSAAAAASQLSMARTVIKSALSGSSALTRFSYPVGKVMGGSSAVNGALFMPGTEEDFAEWVELGNANWSWEKVRPYFDKVVMTGYPAIPRELATDTSLHVVQRDFIRACVNNGFSEIDYLYQDGAGVGRVPRNLRSGIRISAALAYLGGVRARYNLHVMANAQVMRLLMEKNRAVGVEVLQNGAVQSIRAGRVILCAGALHSPGLLMHSGVGPAARLERLGIKPCVDLPGVGENLQDHASVGVWMVPRSGVCYPYEEVHQTMLRYTARDTIYRNDMQLYALSSVDTHGFPELNAALGCDLGISITVVLGKPFSRGRVELADADPLAEPLVYLNVASDPRDMQRLMEGVRLAWRLAGSMPLNAHVARVFAWNRQIIDSDRILAETIATFVRGSWHAVGTARMGPVQDSLAVVDENGFVHGCEQLVVADASVMPSIPRAPTNMTCMMIAEKLAAGLRGPRSSEADAVVNFEEEYVF